MTTIVFPEVKSEFYSGSYCNFDNALQEKDFFDRKNDRILLSSLRDEKIIKSPFGHGLLGTIYLAYAKHVPLVLRPDDIWIAIVIAFGNYVKNHSEQMRNVFVSHTGRKELIVSNSSPNLENTTAEHWNTFINQMADQIKKNTVGDIAQWTEPDFTTTTVTDRTVSRIALMGAVEEYFSMGFELCCGLSKVHLAGVLEDWQKLRLKAEKLRDFGMPELSAWSELLIAVLDQFVLSYQGKIDTEFWQRICTNKRRGSGSQQTFRGWFLVFAPFDRAGRYVSRSKEKVDSDHMYGEVRDDDIVDGGINVRVKIDDHGKLTQAVFYAGLLYTSETADKEPALQPKAAWFLIEKEEIGLKQMLSALDDRLKIRKSINVEHRAYLEGLVDFIYYAAQKFHFPNDKLIDLIWFCDMYYLNEVKGKPRNSKYKYFLKFLLRKDIYGNHNPYRKYVDEQKIKDICEKYPKT